MTGPRERIFQTLKRGLGRDGANAAAQAAVNSRISDPQRNLIPQRAQIPQPQQVELFVAKVTALAVTVDRVADERAVPGAVADWLAQHNVPSTIRLAPDPRMEQIPWGERPMLTIEKGPAEARDMASVTPAFAGIAETGTLMLHSSPTTPTTLHFVPDNHIVVLRASQVTGTLEDAFARLRAAVGGAANWPRTVNFVTGPSRTADIEGVPVLGAHGPRRLHIVLIDDAAETS